MATARRPWSRQELLVAFRLYCRTPFGRLHARNPDIIELAGMLGRTPASVTMKTCNFASLDPQERAREIKALGNVSRADRELWEQFASDSQTIAAEAESAFEAMVQKLAPEEEAPIRTPSGPTERQVTIQSRRIQSFFRAAVLTAYENRCSVTGLAVPALLTASHIVPWSVDERRRADPRNGICLNALHDRAFDRGLFTLDGELRIVLSSELRAETDNTLQHDWLMSLEGRPIQTPCRFKPSPDALEYHREFVFQR